MIRTELEWTLIQVSFIKYVSFLLYTVWYSQCLITPFTSSVRLRDLQWDIPTKHVCITTHSKGERKDHEPCIVEKPGLSGKQRRPVFIPSVSDNSGRPNHGKP